MAQNFFGTLTAPQLPLLDANFTELYGFARNLVSDGAGRVLIGTANVTVSLSASDVGCVFEPGGLAQFSVSGNAALRLNRIASDGQVALFSRGGTPSGSISVTTTATAYNTSSDYRLKSAVQALTGSGSFIDALRPKVWIWPNGSAGVGFIAHEVAEVSPSSVIGEKDAVDKAGNPVFQAMEYGSSEFMANIVAELQALRIRVAESESRLAALEAAVS